jgi:glycosyltransferase involved in cell wall biosynthesis
MVFPAKKPSGPAWPKGVEVSESISDSTVRSRPLISVYIITFNEEENIDRALKSVAWADEIIVLDSGSTDCTLEKARELGARTLTHPFHDFVEQKNRALELCSGEWAFNMDADEEVTESLRRSIETVVNAGFPTVSARCTRYPAGPGTWDGGYGTADGIRNIGAGFRDGTRHAGPGIPCMKS